jgi:hypothetical protein
LNCHFRHIPVLAVLFVGDDVVKALLPETSDGRITLLGRVIAGVMYVFTPLLVVLSPEIAIDLSSQLLVALGGQVSESLMRRTKYSANE